MYNLNQDAIPRKLRQWATLASELDLVSEGAMEAPAHRIVAKTAGNIWIVELGDHHGQQIAVEAYDSNLLIGFFEEVALGIEAVKLCTGGSYPAVLATDQSIVLRLDESTIKDSGADVTVAFVAGSYTLTQIVAAINVAYAAAYLVAGLSVFVPAAEATGQLQITGRAHGTAGKVEVVSIGATLATATGLTVATTSGAATGAAAGLIVQW
ncbi:MAG TPA: hypothetical protein VF382_05740 [Actinomycetota bacterium]